MNTRLILPIAVPAASFSITLAYLWLEQAAPTAGTVLPALSATHSARQAGPEADAHVTFAAQTRAMMPPVAPPAPRATPAETAVAVPAHDPTDPRFIDVPVALLMRHNRDEPGVSGILQNMSTDDINVTVTIVSAKTHLRSTVDVDLHASQRRVLAREGVTLESGDEATVESPPYRKLVLTAP